MNADGLVSTGQGLLGSNMFAYCGNNPVIFRDSGGTMKQYSHRVDISPCIIVGGAAAVVGGGMLSGVFDAVGDALSDLGTAIGNGLSSAWDWLSDTVAGALSRPSVKEEAKAEEKEKEKEKDITTSPKNNVVYYGADIYGGTWKIVTGPLNAEEAIGWVNTTASSNVYGKNASWGLYTANEVDALTMATILGGGAVPIPHQGNAGQYSHFHVEGFVLLNKYKHFHLWYGELN